MGNLDLLKSLLTYRKVNRLIVGQYNLGKVPVFAIPYITFVIEGNSNILTIDKTIMKAIEYYKNNGIQIDTVSK